MTLAVLVHDDSDYGGANSFWLKGKYDVGTTEEALRLAFTGDGWKPRGADRRVIHAIVIGPEIGWQSFDVEIHYPPSLIASITPAKRAFEGADDEPGPS